MAISKKSLGKVLAISMASAMAMSSLSAALVNVSAVSPAALANTGSVSLNDEAGPNSDVDIEAALQAALNADDDNRADAMVGKTFNLNNLSDILMGNSNSILYTDSNGLEHEVEFARGDISYRVSSGAVKKADDNTIEAVKAGSATLRMEVKGKVDLGGGKTEKSVTLSHSFTIDVREKDEFNLLAYKSGESVPLCKTDVNDLAAYGGSIDFKLVQYQEDGANFNPKIAPVNQAAATPTQLSAYRVAAETNIVAKADVIDAVKKAIDDKAADATAPVDYTGYKDAVEAAINAVGGADVTTLTADNKSTGGAAPTFDLKKAGDAVSGFQLTLNTATDVVKTPQANYQGAGDDAPHENWDTDTAKYITNTGTTLNDTGFKEVTYTDADGNDVTYYALQDGSTNATLQAITATTTLAGEQNATYFFEEVAVTDVDNTATDNVWQVDDATSGTLSISTANNAADTDHTKATVYKLKEATNVEMNADIKYATAEDMTTDITTAIAGQASDATNKVVSDTKDGNTIYYIAGATGDTKPVLTDIPEGLQKFFSATIADLDEALIPAGQVADTEAIAFVTAAYDQAIDDLLGDQGGEDQGTVTTEEVKTEIAGINSAVQNAISDEAAGIIAGILTKDNAGNLSVNSTALNEVATGQNAESVLFAGASLSDDQAVTTLATALAKTTAAGKELKDGVLYQNNGTFFTTKTTTTLKGITAQLVNLDETATGSYDSATGAVTESSVNRAANDVNIWKPVTASGSDPVVLPEVKFKETNAVKALLDQITESGDTTPGEDDPSQNVTPGTGYEVRFYAGTGDSLFDYDDENPNATGDWEKGSRTGTKGITINPGAAGQITLDTNGSVGAGSVKVSVKKSATDRAEEFVLNLRVVKAADFGSSPVTIERSGSKTINSQLASGASAYDKNLNGFEIRTTGNVSIENGTVGKIRDAASVVIDGGRAGVIDAADGARVEVTEDGIVGDIINAAEVEVRDGGQAGVISSGNVHFKEGTIAGIDTDGTVTIEGGQVTGDVKSSKRIEITSDDTDTNDDPMDVTIGGNVVGSGDDATIRINNESEDGAASISIGGYVLSRYVADVSSGSVTIGDSNTTGPIRIQGVAEGEHIILGGNGLVTLAGVRAANEVEHTDDDGEIIESTLAFEGFNSTINAINSFANVEVNEGTVIVDGAVDARNLTVGSDAQLVADSITIEEDIIDSGSIVVPLGQLTVTGSVDDNPTLTFLGDITEDALAFVGNRGMVDAFETGGITLKAVRQSNNNYNYLVSKAELNGLTAVGKDVATGVGQEKSVSIAMDGALPQDATIAWSVDDSAIATVTGNGTNATITGEDVGTTTVTARVVDANGRDLGYEDATFDVNVLDNVTVDSIGGEIALDTKAVGMDVGQSYSFLVRENSDTDNITLSYDSNIVDVALAQADYNGRGALYTITAKANGSTNVTVNYKGASSSVAVKVGGFKLDTAAKDLAPGQTYSFLAKNVPADQAANVKLEYDANVATVALAQADYNGRGALFTVTGNQVGSTEIKATYNNEEATMAVNVVEYTGRMTLDTASYTMPRGGTYTIGVKIEQNGRQLSGEEVNAMIARDELRVRDSRTGTIINAPQVLANGNVRVTGKNTDGTTYVLFEVVQNGQVVTHASVGVTVRAGATAEGSSRRSISQW